MRATVLALVLACASAAAQPRKEIALRSVIDEPKAPRFLAIPVAPRRLGDGCALQSGGKLLDLLPGGPNTVVINGASYGPGEVCRLRIDGPAPGQSLPYALRVVPGRFERPCLVPACAMAGTLAGTAIAIIDANLNGRYDDYGVDMMAVGRSRYAYPLSRYVVAGGKPHEIEVRADGAALSALAYEERLFKFDPVAQLQGPLSPELVVMAREVPGGVDYATVEGARPARLPSGVWRLACAVMSEDVWVLGAADGPAVDLREGDGALRWGAPYALRAQPCVEGQGRVRTFTPAQRLVAPRLDERVVDGTFIVIHEVPEIVGAAGERYIGPWTRRDRMGSSLADPAIAAFEVVVAQDGRTLNLGATRWAPWDLSGLVEKVAPYWLSFDVPAAGVAGTVQVELRADSPRFGPLSGAHAVELAR